MEKDTLNNILNEIMPGWSIESTLGSGSFGQVYKVVKEEDGARIESALKVIHVPQRGELNDFESRGYSYIQTKNTLQNKVNSVMEEIKVMCDLNDTQNTVSIADFGLKSNTTELKWIIFIRMELLTPLEDYQYERNLTENDVINLGGDICNALENCRKHNIVHRDIKPANIFVDSKGIFKLGDFGIAKKLGNGVGTLSARYTPMYVAPEAIRGENTMDQLDVYSLGMVLYKITNDGNFPFVDNTLQMVTPEDEEKAYYERIKGNKVPMPANASKELGDVILHALEPDPKNRYKTAADFHHDLMLVRDGNYKVRDDVKKVNVWIRGALALAVILVITVIGVTVFRKNPKEDDVSDRGKITDSSIVEEVDNYSITDTEVMVSGEEAENSEGEVEKILLSAQSMAEKGDYQQALVIIQEALNQYPNHSSLLSKKKEYEDNIAIQDALKEAEKKAFVDDYESACDILLKCIDEHGSSSDIKSAYDEYKSAYVSQIKEIVLPKAQSAADVENYKEAYGIIQDALKKLDSDSELLELASYYENCYVEKIVNEVNNFLDTREFDAASEEIDNALMVLPKNQALLEVKDLVTECMPKKLLSVCPPYETNYVELSSYFTMADDVYKDGLLMDGTTTGYGGYAYFNLKGEYDVLEFDFGHLDGTQMNNCEYYIYTDNDTMILKLQGQASALPKHYVVELDGTNQLKIVSGYGGIWDPTYAFANMVVY